MCLCAAGCLGGQTGTEGRTEGTGSKGPPSWPDAACVPEVTELRAEQSSPLGFTAQALLAAVTGAHVAELRWNAAPPELDFGPEQGLSSVGLAVTPSGTPARFVHWVPRALGPDVGGCSPDEVQLDAQVALTTDGGAFAERFPVVLHATRADAAHITISLPLASLSGGFSVSLASGVRTNAVVLDAELGAGVTRGTLRGQLERTLGDVASAQLFTYACWPASDAQCAGP
jgi:hypothetical protein